MNINISWLAGLIDGEGSFTVMVHKDRTRKRFLHVKPIITISMYTGTGKWVKRTASIFKIIGIKPSCITRKADYRSNHVFNDSYTIFSVQGKANIRKLSKVLHPYLTIKKPHAKLFSTWPEKRLIFVVTQTGRLIKYQKNINEVVSYLRQSRELNRKFRPSKWTADMVAEYYKNLA